jgi:hypothetical protein
MRAGVRPGLQILRVCLWWTGRFDSDTLPPKPSAIRGLWKTPVASRENGAPLMSPRKPPKKEPFRAWKEVKRQARERIGTPRPTKREENARGKPPKHRKRELEVLEEET